MKQQGLAFFTQIDLSILAMMIFFIWFIIMLLWVYKIIPRQHHERLAQLPLQDEVSNGR
jgi:hypothetical protein